MFPAVDLAYSLSELREAHRVLVNTIYWGPRGVVDGLGAPSLTEEATALRARVQRPRGGAILEKPERDQQPVT